MSLPKEPRQKMINMMYLVLTAMLALNVSAEILNAFSTVNNSITESNGVISAKNNTTYKSFDDAMADPATRGQAEKWAPKATQVRNMSDVIVKKIEDLKAELKKESGLEMREGKEFFRIDDLDAPIRTIDQSGKGKILYADLKNYKASLLNLLNPAEFADNPLLQKEMATAQANFARTLPLNLAVPKSEAGNEEGSDSVQNWVTNYFHMTPTIASLTILSKFQNDVKGSESQIADFLRKQIGAVKIVYDKFQPLIGTNATYLMPGDELEVKAGIGAFSAAAAPDITINGAHQSLDADGAADYKTKVSATGSVQVKIAYKKPDGTTDIITKDVKYTVGMPSGASVFLQKMNVVYVGVDNPLTISGGSVGREKVHVTFTSPGAALTNTGGDAWSIKPTTVGMAKIMINADGKMFEFPIRVKQLPLPAGFVGTKKGGSMSSAEFRAIGGLIARLEDSDFEAPFKVVSYKIGALGGGVNTYQEAVNEGNRFTGAGAAIVAKATPGTNVFFDNIRVVGPDGKQREISPMVFKLQ